jgi:putative CocE/NonD family hydrolase
MFPLVLSVVMLLPHSPNQVANSSGAYDIYINGIRKGYSRYSLDDRERLSLEGDAGFGFASRGTVTFRGDDPQQVEFEVTGNNAIKLTYTIENGEMQRKSGESETKAAMPPGSAFYYPTQPILLQNLLERLPAGGSGFRKLPAIDLLTGKPRDIEAELYRTETRRIRGKAMRLRLWRLLSAPTPDAVVYTDETDRPLYWWVPARQYEMVLQGFEELRAAYPDLNRVSQPGYRVKVEHDVAMRMRDGILLMADVYRPDAAGWFPVLLQRTCYDRSEFGNDDGEFYAQRGYVYVTQHVRGRGNSEGEFTPFLQEAKDGSDSVDWCASQPWSNGRVGTLGASYNGYCEWMTATTRPKALKAMIATVAMAGPPDGAPWAGGSYFAWSELQWYGLLRDKAKTQPFNTDITVSQNTLPLIHTDDTLFGKHIPSFDYWLQRDRMDEGVKQGSYRDKIGDIDVPVLHVSGWLDGTAVGTRLNYMQMVAHGARHQKLVWGPWDHFTNRESLTGLRDFGPEAYIDPKMLYLRWFDRWLKGRRNGIDAEPPVSTYLLNEHRWERSNSWPSTAMTRQQWYLHAPASSGAVGKLSLQAPQQETPERYTYDPARYVYSQDNQESFFFSILDASDQSRLCTTADHDRLVYDTEPLAQPLRLCGPIRGTLYAATSATDTDWVMALLDVFPDGKAVTLGSGMVRARFRNSYERPTLLEPDRPYRYDIDMWQTGIAIPAGHRLRVVVLSTLFPDRDRNLNTGESIATGARMLVAQQTLFHEPDRASHIVLPVLPPARRG